MKTFKTSFRDRNGQWHHLADIHAASMAMARNIAKRQTAKQMRGTPETHYPIKGCAVYEYDNGAISVEKIS